MGSMAESRSINRKAWNSLNVFFYLLTTFPTKRHHVSTIAFTEEVNCFIQSRQKSISLSCQPALFPPGKLSLKYFLNTLTVFKRNHPLIVMRQLGLYLHYIENFSCQKLKLTHDFSQILNNSMNFHEKIADVKRFIYVKIKLSLPRLIHREGGQTIYPEKITVGPPSVIPEGQ